MRNDSVQVSKKKKKKKKKLYKKDLALTSRGIPTTLPRPCSSCFLTDYFPLADHYKPGLAGGGGGVKSGGSWSWGTGQVVHALGGVKMALGQEGMAQVNHGLGGGAGQMAHGPGLESGQVMVNPLPLTE